MKPDVRISIKATLKDSMQLLDKTAKKVLLVVDEEGRLLGTLTDGDIRRHILEGNPLDNPIKSAYNPNPMVLQRDSDFGTVKKLMVEKGIELVPVVDQGGLVVDYFVWDEIFEDKKEFPTRIREIPIPVVIMAGGKGTRLDPLTKILPKPLIPIGNRPILEIIMDKFKEYGIKDYYLTINHMSKIIRAYFEEREDSSTITFVEEDEPLGTAGSLRLLETRLKSQFFVTNCDIIIDTNYGDLYDFHIENEFDITLVASVRQFSIPYGVCEIENGGRLACINEKPEYNFLANAGLYVMNASVLRYIPTGCYFDMTDLINATKSKGGNIGVYPVSEKSWMDIGQWDKYKDALNKIIDK